MIGLALRSLRYRATTFTATFLSILLGTALIGSFATLVETSTGPVPSVDRETLVIMGGVVGGWGTLLVLFSVASTLGIAVRQREVEIGLLRTVGTTPRQARRMIRVEALLVAMAAATVGAALAWLAGRALLALIRDGGLVSQSVEFAGGPASLGLSALVVVATSLVSATIAGRKATSGPAKIALTDGIEGTGKMPWWRVLAGVVLIGYGLAMAVVTVAVTADAEDPYEAMATAGSNSILVGVGLAVLAPTLLRWFAGALRPLVGRAGATGHLAAFNTSRRAHLLSGVLAPVIVFTAASIGTLMLVGIDGRTTLDGANPDADTITLLNNVVVGMIALFAAIMVVNSFAAVIAHRRTELARLRLLGATTTQVRRSVLAEAAIVAGVGVVLGAIASLATIVPFSVARSEGVVPDGQLWLPFAMITVALLLTLVSALGAVRRTAAASVPALAGARQ